MTKSTAAIRTVNVTRLFRQASDAELEAGLRWYPEAHVFAADLAEQSGHPVSTAAAIVAAVSPRLGWDHNKRLAERIILTGDASSGYLGSGLRRAQRLLDGERPFDVLTSRKILNFYVSILSAGGEGVCVDRHAYDVATNTRHDVEAERPGITPARYDRVAQCYRNAAHILRRETGIDTLTAAEVQAVTWVTWRNRIRKAA